MNSRRVGAVIRKYALGTVKTFIIKRHAKTPPPFRHIMLLIGPLQGFSVFLPEGSFYGQLSESIRSNCYLFISIARMARENAINFI